MLDFIKDDYKSHALRFLGEALAWGLSMACSLIMALTVPNPPLIILYCLWITGCSLNLICAYSRKSFGISMNYLGLVIIDLIALFRLV